MFPDSRKQKTLDVLLPDKADFTPTHDQLFFLLQKDAENAAAAAIRMLDRANGHDDDAVRVKGKFVGEPILDGYPPAYPDGILRGHASTEFDYGERRVEVIFEIKPRLDSFGSILRQLRLYESRSKRDRPYLVLVTPDAKWDAEFLREGVAVLHPEASW